MKIPFTLDAWLKDKSQNVETRDGRKIHNIWRIKEPSYTNNRKAEVCALIDGEEDALVFFEGGRYLPTTKDTDNPFDLFLITPGPELSEFEKRFLEIVVEIVEEKDNECPHPLEYAAELLELARKELVKKGTSKNEMGTILYDAGFEDGKEEALKDLPRWEKRDSEIYNTKFNFVVNGVRRYIILDGYMIDVDSLEKLPGFNE